MKKTAKHIIKSNFSLLLIVLGAGSNFLLILFLNKYYPHLFDLFSLYLTFIGIIATFGFLGLDQVFLRVSTIHERKIVVGRDLVLLLLLLLFVSPLILSLYFNSRFEKLPFFLLLISGVSINAIILAYNYFRLQKEFVLSQAFKAGYSFLFLFFILLGSLFYSIGVEEVIFIASTILFLFGLGAIHIVFKKIVIEKKTTESLFGFFVSFFFNIGILTLISYGERILIANELGEETFGKYFYYSTIFLFPLTLLQQYIGFKELVYFKEKIEKGLILKKLKQVFLFGSTLLLLILIVVVLDNGMFLNIDLTNEKTLILLLCILGLVKVCYSLFSAIIGAKGEYKFIHFINVITAGIIILFITFIYYSGITVNKILLSLILIYIVRSTLIHFKYAK